MDTFFKTMVRLALGACVLLAGAGCTAFSLRGQQAWRSLTNHRYPSEAAGTPAFEDGLDLYTQSRAHQDTAALILENGDEAYPAMLDLIASARERISLETYIIENDDTTDRFFDALRDAARRGVTVRVLVDAAGFKRGMVAHLRDLREDGIETRVFNPFLLSWTVIRGNNRDHRKILVVDGKHAVLGGINLSDDQLGDGVSGWRDTSLLVSGPVALDAERVFAETWEQGGRAWLGRNLPVICLNPLKRAVDAPFLPLRDQLFDTRPFVPTALSPPPGYEAEEQPPVPYQSHTASVRVVASSPDRANSPIYDLTILAIHGARERIDVACAYFVPPNALRHALAAAARRGVRIRLLLPGVTDVRFVREFGMRFYGELLEAGIEIHEWPYPILHSKTMAVDGKWLMVGSANMDGRSYFLNYEAVLAASDETLARIAHSRFEEDLTKAKPLTLAEWQTRPASQRAFETLTIPFAGQY